MPVALDTKYSFLPLQSLDSHSKSSLLAAQARKVPVQSFSISKQETNSQPLVQYFKRGPLIMSVETASAPVPISFSGMPSFEMPKEATHEQSRPLGLNGASITNGNTGSHDVAGQKTTSSLSGNTEQTGVTPAAQEFLKGPANSDFKDPAFATVVHEASVSKEGTVISLPTLKPVEKPAAFTAPIPGATKLKRLLEETNELIVCPGVYDGLSARVALEVGFSALYMVRFPPLHTPKKKISMTQSFSCLLRNLLRLS